MKKIKLTAQRHRQRRRSRLSVPIQSKVAQHRVEFVQVMRMKIDGQGRGGGQRISAQMAAHLQLAGRRFELELAQVDGAVALRIRRFHHAARRCLAGHSLP